MPDAISFNPVVIAPTYNNARTLGGIVDEITAMGFKLIVINDGSTDDTASVLASRESNSNVTILTHPKNRGKAAALRTGFAKATEAGFTHALSIDTDGQHDPAEIPKLIDAARNQPESLVLGLRDESAPGYPSNSKLGRRLSNLAIRMESGHRVEDSQCGMRGVSARAGERGAVRSGTIRIRNRNRHPSRCGRDVRSSKCPSRAATCLRASA